MPAHSRGVARRLKPLCIVAGLTAAGTPATATPESPEIVLNNGVRMPVLSYGANLYSAETCKKATAWALQAGFRFIWSSEIIGAECQGAQRDALDASGVPREEVFLAGTVDTQGCSTYQDCYQQTQTQAEGQFSVLRSKQLDMLMLDYPSKSGCTAVQGQWKAFEELYAAHRVRSIAVSNFGEAELQCLANTPGATQPAVNQLRYNVGAGARSLMADNQKFGVVVQAYSPLGSGKVLQDPVVVSIAQAHRKSPAQIALKWLVQQGAGVNLASTSLPHLQEDVSLFDFELSAAEMAQLGARGSSGIESKAETIAVDSIPLKQPSMSQLLAVGALWTVLLPGAIGASVAGLMKLSERPPSAMRELLPS